MPSRKEDIDFLKAQLKKRQKWYEDGFHLMPSDLLPEPDIPVTSPDEERIARLADKNGFDGSLFRNLTKDYEPLSIQSIRHLKKQIETIPQIIAKIEESDETDEGWHIENGQVFFNGTDLQFPAGQIQDVMQKLVESEGKTVCNKELDAIATGKHKHHIGTIRKFLKHNIPYEIKTVKYEGYILRKK